MNEIVTELRELPDGWRISVHTVGGHTFTGDFSASDTDEKSVSLRDGPKHISIAAAAIIAYTFEVGE